MVLGGTRSFDVILRQPQRDLTIANSLLSYHTQDWDTNDIDRIPLIVVQSSWSIPIRRQGSFRESERKGHHEKSVIIAVKLKSSVCELRT